MGSTGSNCESRRPTRPGPATIAATFGPTAEIPDPRAKYNGWMSDRMGVTETLTGIGYDLSLAPRRAEGIEQIDPTTWRATLRDGVALHDGSPVTAQAAAEAIFGFADEDGPGYNARLAALIDLAGVEADGDRVIVIKRNAPDAAFPFTRSDPGIAILGTPSDAFPINATGPNIFEEAVPDQTYRLAANPDYRLGPPVLGTEGASNAGGYSNAARHALLADGRTRFEQAERKAIYDEVQALAAEEAALIPVFHVSPVVAAMSELRGFQVHPTETY
jgi:ABC-type transport system substrate-binding protein